MTVKELDLLTTNGDDCLWRSNEQCQADGQGVKKRLHGEACGRSNENNNNAASTHPATIVNLDSLISPNDNLS
jgi:hypothetical protein